MKHRWSIPLAAAVLCLAVSISAGWLWHTLSETNYEARARLTWAADPFADADGSGSGETAQGAIEELVFSPEVLTSAVALLHERGVLLSLASPFDSETEYLLSRLHVDRPDQGGTDEIQITCAAADPDETREMLTAIVDALLAGVKAPRPETGEPASEDSENERKQLARAIERQERAVAALGEQIKTAKKAAEPVQDPQALESELHEARRTLSLAEGRLDEAHHDFDRKLPAEAVAARLADGPVRTKILERLNLSRLHDELRQEQELLEKWSSVYGRNHPRMTEIRGKIEQLQQQVARFPAEPADLSQTLTDVSPLLLVMNALESDLADAQSAQHDLESRLAAAHDARKADQALEVKLAEARQELAFLHAENGRIRRQIDDARHAATRQLPTVIEQPTLSPDPIAPRAGLQMAVSCVAGMALYLLLLRQFHPRRQDAAARTRKTSPLPARRKRFLSQQEQQLARLKMLSVAQ